MRKAWRTRLAQAQVNGHFNGNDHHDVMQWPHCAIGEHLTKAKKKLMATQGGSRVLSRRAVRLGTDFAIAVDWDDVTGAKKLYDKIQALAQKKGVVKA